MYQKTTLDNGLRVITSHMPHTHSVCIAIFINIGSRYESDTEAGTSHFIEHILFRGTQKRPTPREISEAIEGVGGILNGATDKELIKKTRTDLLKYCELDTLGPLKIMEVLEKYRNL